MLSIRLEYNTESDEHRELMLVFLQYLEISWPREFKLPSAAVPKRLSQTLDYAQSWEVISNGNNKVELSEHPLWKE
jgi:hypothetical protein